MHHRTGQAHWYQRGALQPMTGSDAVRRNDTSLKLNREGRAAFKGQGKEPAGDTGRSACDVYYCGAEVGSDLHRVRTYYAGGDSARLCTLTPCRGQLACHQLHTSS